MGQCCMLAACYLLHCSAFTDTDEVIKFVNDRRKSLVVSAENENDTISRRHSPLSVPSQIRYVHYYEMMLRTDHVRCKTYLISDITIMTIPHTSANIINGGCINPYISLSVLAHNDEEEIRNAWFPKRIYNQLNCITKKLTNNKLKKQQPLRSYIIGRDDKMTFDMLPYDVNVRGDVCLSFFSEGEKLVQLYFNTCFINDNDQDNCCLVFDKEFIDIACDDVYHYTYDKEFKIMIHLKQVKDDPSINIYKLHIVPSSNDGVDPPVVYDRDEYKQMETELRELLFMYTYGDTNIV